MTSSLDKQSGEIVQLEHDKEKAVNKVQGHEY